MDLSAMPWLFAVLGGAVILGLVMAYSAYKSAHASRRQRNAAERGAQKIYDEEDRES